VLLRTHVFPDVVDSLIFYWFLFCVNLLIFAAVTSEQIYAIFSSCVSNSCSYQAVGVSTPALRYIMWSHYLFPRPTQPSIPPGSVNEDKLWLGRQRQVWFIPLVDECGVCR